MEDTGSKEDSHTVDRRAARLLGARPQALRYLAPFAVAEHTLTSAARSIDVAPSTLAYWVPRFVSVGLLRQVRRERRAGMSSPVYRTVASTLLVPFELLDPMDAERLVRAGRESLLDELSRALVRSTLGRRLALVLRGKTPTDLYGNIIELPRQPRTSSIGFERFERLRLRREDAADLVDEITRLVNKYAARPPSGTTHLVHVAVARER